MVRILVNRSTVKCVFVFVFTARTVQFVGNCPSVLGQWLEGRIASVQHRRRLVCICVHCSLLSCAI